MPVPAKGFIVIVTVLPLPMPLPMPTIIIIVILVVALAIALVPVPVAESHREVVAVGTLQDIITTIQAALHRRHRWTDGH